MKAEQLFERTGYQGQGNDMPAMFKADEMKIDAIVSDYLHGKIQSKEMRKRLRAIGYDVYPNNTSAWVAGQVQLISLGSEKAFMFSH